MRATSTLIPALLALVTVASGPVAAASPPPGSAGPTSSTSSAAASAAASTAASTATDPGSEATPLFSVTPAPACSDPLCFWADSHAPGVSLTLSRTHMVMINPEIVDTTRGIAHITADHGEESGPEVGNSRWVFTGHIRADMTDGQLRADTATVQIVDGRIVSINAQGSPALFQRPATQASDNAPAARGAAGQKASFASLTVRGHADSITYDAGRDQVQFSGNSWFTDGCNELTSQLVTYDMRTQTVQAGAKPGGNARVHGTIRNTRPGSSSRCSAGTDTGTGTGRS